MAPSRAHEGREARHLSALLAFSGATIRIPDEVPMQMMSALASVPFGAHLLG